MTLPEWRPKLLVVDDEPDLLPLVRRLAARVGFDVIEFRDGKEALAQLAAIKPDAALLDKNMPGLGGLDVLRSILDVQPDCHVIMMTGAPDLETAIEALKLGARDYLTKPFGIEALSEAFETVRLNRERRETLQLAASGLASQFAFQGMVGNSPAMQELFDAIRRFAPHMRTALVIGETGTGKELVAQALHKLSRKRNGPFLTLNCSAVVETLFESELFGHVRGAFTGATEAKAGRFASADGGTLFLDEVGELLLPLQAKLLRAVELGEVQRVGALDTTTVDVQVVAATNRDLLDYAGAGKFRSDLYYRLSVVEIRLPPLRDRRGDIPYLTAVFIKAAAARLHKSVVGLTTESERLLLDADWPGNVRQLQHVIERACILSDSQILGHREVLAAMHRAPAANKPVAPSAAHPLEDSRHLLRDAERDQILKTLRDAGGNKTKAARDLGISRRALYRWLERIDPRA
ncbi:MAG TPA: sigma-54 dependent transcriptional regulator [Vicinamibacterales bacterium]|nr:sigma-54 dependent transcriptional regulator [Vicinamibacterales bacterium]